MSTTNWHLPRAFAWASLVAQSVKNLPAMQETWVRSLGWENPLEEGVATHASILAWSIPWTDGKLSSDHRSGKGQFSFQFQRKAVPKNAQVKVKVAQSCPTLCDPMNCRILQARILERVAFPFSRGSSQPRDRTQVSRNAGRFFTN